MEAVRPLRDAAANYRSNPLRSFKIQLKGCIYKTVRVHNHLALMLFLIKIKSPERGFYLLYFDE